MSNSNISFTGADPREVALSVRVAGDTHDRLQVRADGSTRSGGGSAAPATGYGDLPFRPPSSGLQVWPFELASTQITMTSTRATIWQATVPTSPATLVVWRTDDGSAGDVLTAPDRYALIPINGYRTKITDTGANINGRAWISTSVPVPNTVGAANATWDHVAFGSVFIGSGSGTPESAITAPVGSLYLRTDGSTSTTLYVKTSGTGNTGWTAK